MRLSDIMGNMNLAIWPQIALFIFLAVFISITYRTFRADQKEVLQETSLLPLSDLPPVLADDEHNTSDEKKNV